MKLLMATRMGDPYFSLLDDFKDVEIAWAGSPDEVARQIVDADAVYGWPTREQFLAAKRLKWIQVPSAGVEMLCSIPEIVESDVVMTNARGAHARVIAEHAFAMLLAFTRGILPFEQDKAARRWRREQAIPEVQEIAGWTIGIVGYGQIGQQVTQRALGFEMAVLAVDVAPMPDAPHGVDVWGPDRLPELMERSDVVVVATPYTPRTRQMLGADLLGRMKPTAYLLVVSRGGIVDEPALVDVLRKGKIAGAGLDVFAEEPLPPTSELWDLPNLIVTPHLAGASTQKDRRCVEILRENVGRFQRGEELINVVDKRLGY
ncbi:MAG: D-2-hydroxyacid dehydrogenase [Chloroflexota bacterium]|nr:D-2-hydroxyacid dehydrogenase [Chloroflexota bacterium]